MAKINRPTFISAEKSASPLGKIPPQSLEAEQSVLGALMINQDAIAKIADSLHAEDFYRQDHAAIFAAMLTLYEKRMPIDVVTLTDQLERSNQLSTVGGATAIASLANAVPSSVHVVSYARIVREKATLRRLISAATAITELGFQEESGVDELLDQAEQTLFAVSQRFTAAQFVPIRSVLTESFERIDDLHRHRGKLRGVPTGITPLDNLIAGLQASDLVILAARPSMGKTALALNFAAHAAEQGIAVGIFSLEQSKEQLVDRLLASQSGIDAWKLRTGNLSEDDFPRLGEAMGILAEVPLFIDDTPNLTVMEIRTKARRLQSESGLGLLVVDYLQLMQGRPSRDPNRVQEISEISRGLKGLARELNIPVLALSQLSRAVEQRPNHTPQLSDLRESGSIEQDADVVMFLYREDYYDPETDRQHIADLLVRKHRNGPIGEVELFFHASQTKFRAVDTRHSGSGE